MVSNFSLAGGDIDIIDEAIQYFKANIFFKNFEIKVCRQKGSD
jgi:actin related protein 2/3 complex subunit 3